MTNIMPRQTVTILGATGSIGRSTLDVLARHPERFTVHALVAQSNVDRMLQQVLQHRPRYAVLENPLAAKKLQHELTHYSVTTTVMSGSQAILATVEDSEVTTVVAGIVGAAGLAPTLAAVEQGKRVLLANKEALVMAGQLFMSSVSRCGAELMPVDSEHNAIFQCLPQPFRSLQASGVKKILLTGSGGPFRDLPLDQFTEVTAEQACAHPNWTMGRKISVDSATMMNKGLEFIEACWLFGASPADIQVLLHPQSIIHSMVEYLDGSIVAQMGQPDMRTPIAHCLGFPERLHNGVASLDFLTLGQLTFSAPCLKRFPCLKLATDAMVAGGTYPVALNAANEVAVQAFLNGALDFPSIAALVGNVMEKWTLGEPDDLDVVIGADRLAREMATNFVNVRQSTHLI